MECFYMKEAFMSSGDLDLDRRVSYFLGNRNIPPHEGYCLFNVKFPLEICDNDEIQKVATEYIGKIWRCSYRLPLKRKKEYQERSVEVITGAALLDSFFEYNTAFVFSEKVDNTKNHVLILGKKERYIVKVTQNIVIGKEATVVRSAARRLRKLGRQKEQGEILYNQNNTIIALLRNNNGDLNDLVRDIVHSYIRIAEQYVQDLGTF